MPACFVLYLVLECVGVWASRTIHPREWGFADGVRYPPALSSASFAAVLCLKVSRRCLACLLCWRVTQEAAALARARVRVQADASRLKRPQTSWR
eukprot:2673801-Rhodomonas_salina.1